MNATATPMPDLNAPLGEPHLPQKKPRLVSLDVLRGLTVAGMVLVNNPGGSAHYWPLEHADWHGMTPTDLVMPFFLFMVGVAIAYAMDSKRDDPALHASLLIRILRRTVMLFLIAYLSSLFPTADSFDAIHKNGFGPWLGDRLAHLRIMGVLARIGVVYFVCSLLFLKTSRRTMFAVTAVLLVGYWAILQFIPVNDVTGSATWEEGHDLGSLIDRHVLGVQHMYIKKPPEFATDPEGLFSSLAAIATGLIGVLTGQYLKRGSPKAPDITSRIAQIFAVGVILCLVGWLWSLGFPLNKKLWTSSFTLVTAGLAMLSLMTLYWAIDVRGSKWWTGPAVWHGVNAITVFAGSAIVYKMFTWHWIPHGDQKVGIFWYVNVELIRKNIHSPELASLTWALLFVSLWTAIVGVLYKLKWMLKV